MNYYRAALVILMNIPFLVTSAQAQYKELEKLLENNQMFELQESFRKNESDLKKWEQLYFTAYIDNAFGRHRSSNMAIDSLMNNHVSSLKKDQIIGLLMCSAANFAKVYDYNSAATTLQKIKDGGYQKKMKPEDRENLENMIILWNSLKNVPEQKTYLNNITEVPIVHNNFNNWIIPVRNDAQSADTIDFVFDSGANISTIRRGIADRMGVIFTGSHVDVSSSVGNKVQAEMGYIPKMFVGDLEMDNVVVLVFPDEMLTFAQIEYTIDGIIGFPVISSFGEFSISKNGKLTIVPENTKGVSQNLFTSGLTPHIMVTVNGNMCTMICDTGAGSSHLGERFYKKNRRLVNKNSKISKSQMAGVGGSKKLNIRVWENFQLTIASRDFTLPKIDVLRKTPESFKNSDGFLGQDILLQPNEIVMNFKDMYLFFRD